MKAILSFTKAFQVERSQRGRKHLREPEPQRDVGHRVPRVAKLMALAIRFEGLVCDGVVADYAELARSWARFTGQDVPNWKSPQSSPRHPGGDPVFGAGGTGEGSNHRAGSAADRGRGGLEEAETNVAPFGGAFENGICMILR